MNTINYTKKPTVYGVGINDADYVVKPTVNGKFVTCPLYSKWKDMIRRCYSPKYQIKVPTYIGCTVANEWFSFMAFRSWAALQNWRGNDLDKDILKPNNKIYSPETCLFVPHSLNMILCDSRASRGKCSLGVSWNSKRKTYKARITINNKDKHLGYFKTEKEAKVVYKKAKSAELRKAAFLQSDYRIAKALMRHASSTMN